MEKKGGTTSEGGSMTTTKRPRKPRVKKTASRVSAEERYIRLQQEAYFLAEKDSFRRNPVEYWLEAEATLKD